MFLEKNSNYREKLIENLKPIASLFSYSQFLANFCIPNPDVLFNALENLNLSLSNEELSGALSKEIISGQNHLKTFRSFRKKEMLRITLRDILKKADLSEIMLELSTLADVIVDGALKIVTSKLNETYGEPKENSFAVISLGKLGSEELNFSSDIDLIFIYGDEDGETSGIKTPQGSNINKISNHEYYCKVGENLNKFLSANTEDGFVYRVDLRLRPEGQKGRIALSLSGYETYYESWGRLWERAMLLRARQIAGSEKIGNEFMEMIKPFVYRKYLDFSAIDEIKQIKERIESEFKKNDIKRGYGGIREIEFFTHALQLLYVGREPLLRERSTLRALYRLFQKNLIGSKDLSALSDNYVFLRTLEHRLQQVDDLQTHSIPSDKNELEILSKKMDFDKTSDFLFELETRKKSTRMIYDSLFKDYKQDQKNLDKQKTEIEFIFDEEIPDTEIKEYLAKTNIKDIDRAIRNIKSIKDASWNFQTLRGRRILNEMLPLFLDLAFKASNPDLALNHLQPFVTLLNQRESYLEIIKENKNVIPLFINFFSQSEYLSKIIIRRPDYLESINQELGQKKSLKTLISELEESLKAGQDISETMRITKQTEELRLGILFLEKKIKVTELIEGLSNTAEAILDQAGENSRNGLTAVAFGKLGGKEITFNSDLDMIFVVKDEVTEKHTKTAEKILQQLLSYTRDGIAYKIDVRLRPDGTKGPLVSSIPSLRKYYLENAAPWELQALLKARPVVGDEKTREGFANMAADILAAHSRIASANDIKTMRERIQRELAKEIDAYDIKLGAGGLEELEFTVQYLQLKNCSNNPELLTQNTLDAVEKLSNAGIIKKAQATFLKNAYIFYRTIESYLRLREKELLKKDDIEILNSAVEFLEFKEKDKLISRLEETRAGVRKFYDLFLV